MTTTDKGGVTMTTENNIPTNETLNPNL